jgi:hypothetical protein
VDEDDLRRREGGEGPPGRANEVGELRRDLDARRSAANDDEPQESLPPVGIPLAGGLFQHRQGSVAEVERVAKAPDTQRVVGHAGHCAKVGHAPERDDEGVVVHRETRSALTSADMDVTADGVDVLDVPDLDVDTLEHASQWDDHVGRLDGARDDVGKEWLEDEVVVATDEGHRNGAAGSLVVGGGRRATLKGQPVVGAKTFRQFLRGGNTGETAAEDHDPLRLRRTRSRGERLVHARNGAHDPVHLPAQRPRRLPRVLSPS